MALSILISLKTNLLYVHLSFIRGLSRLRILVLEKLILVTFKFKLALTGIKTFLDIAKRAFHVKMGS